MCITEGIMRNMRKVYTEGLYGSCVRIVYSVDGNCIGNVHRRCKGNVYMDDLYGRCILKV